MASATVLLLSLIHSTAAVRLVTTTTLPNVTPERALSFLATPTNWPDIVLSSWSVRGDSVDKPLPVGYSVDEIFGLPPILPLEVKWTCTADGNPLIFDSPTGLEGVASNCKMEFTAFPDGSSTNIELVMSYDPVSPLADIASPILAIDNAIALKLTREDGAAMRARLGARTGRTSVPSVWIGGDFVGGLNDGPGLATLDKRGVLDERLRAVGALA